MNKLHWVNKNYWNIQLSLYLTRELSSQICCEQGCGILDCQFPNMWEDGFNPVMYLSHMFII